MFEWLKSGPVRPVLDASYLTRLAGHLGEAELNEILADGLIELTDRLARVAEMASVGDPGGLARLGHDLVGMAGHLGLTRLSAAAAELNRAARDAKPGGIAAAAAVLRHMGAEATEALRLYLAR